MFLFLFFSFFFSCSFVGIGFRPFLLEGGRFGPSFSRWGFAILSMVGGWLFFWGWGLTLASLLGFGRPSCLLLRCTFPLKLRLGFSFLGGWACLGGSGPFLLGVRVAGLSKTQRAKKHEKKTRQIENEKKMKEKRKQEENGKKRKMLGIELISATCGKLYIIDDETPDDNLIPLYVLTHVYLTMVSGDWGWDIVVSPRVLPCARFLCDSVVAARENSGALLFHCRCICEDRCGEGFHVNSSWTQCLICRGNESVPTPHLFPSHLPHTPPPPPGWTLLIDLLRHPLVLFRMSGIFIGMCWS